MDNNNNSKKIGSTTALGQLYETINTPELKTSLYYTLLLTISVIFQLLSDTFITRIVGRYGENYATARGN
jgi:hypothetical protein